METARSTLSLCARRGRSIEQLGGDQNKEVGSEIEER